MSSTKEALLARYEKRLAFDNFFTGRLYPVIVAVLVLFGYFTKQEVFTNAILAVLTFWGLLSCKTVRPLMCYLFTVLYQIPYEHQVQNPETDADSLLSGWRAFVVLGSFALVIIGAMIFLIRQGAWHKADKREGLYRFKPLPLLIPTLLFCLSLFLAGFGTKINSPNESMIFAAGQTVVYLILFAIFFRGFEDENSGELLAYFAYVTLIVACILNVEVACYHINKFIETGTLEFIRNGNEINLGFGNANLIAYNVGLLIPMQLYGFTKCKGRGIYLLSAILTYLSSCSCTSRTATIAATFILILGLILSFFARNVQHPRRVSNRVILLLLVIVIAAVFVVFPTQVKAFFADLDRTFPEKTSLTATTSEGITLLSKTASTMKSKIGQLLDALLGDINLSGRVRIWDECGVAFEQNPIFGPGIYFLDIPGGFELSYMPWLAHNTVMYLLGAGGIVALAAYLLYRFATALVFFVRPTTDKWFLFLVCLFLVISGLTDNYVFYYYTAFHYLVALAIACKINRETKVERLARRERIAEKLSKSAPKA